jgi:hypothetical protein
MYNTFFNLKIYEQFGGQVEDLKKENELGVLVTMDIGYTKETVDRIIAENTPFVPRYTQEGITIPVQVFEDPGAELALMDGLVQMSLMGMYRLVISKRCVANVQRAVLTRYPGDNPLFQGQGPDGSDPFAVDVLDLGDQYLIEVPLLLLLEDSYKFLKLYSK